MLKKLLKLFHNLRIAEKGMSLIEVMVASMIVTIAILIFVSAIAKANIILKSTTENIADYTCVNSVYNYFSNIPQSSLEMYGKDLSVNNIFGNGFDNYNITIGYQVINDTNKCENHFQNNTVQFVVYNFSIKKFDKNIGGFEILKELN